MHTTKRSKVFQLLICFSFCLLFFTGAKAENDVLAGMKIEDALWVTQSCIHEASGIKTQNIRPGDTLEFLGITDELRVDSLRRYIVRNTEIGVQSIWAFHRTDRLAQHYIISNSALKKISKSWTVEKLAREISTNAGLPFLPLKKSAQIIADCRKVASGKADKLATATPINADIPGKTENFVDCLLTNEDKGIPSASITAPQGNVYAYTIAKKIIDGRIIQKGIENGWTYEKLIDFIAEYAQAPLSPELSAAHLVVNAILNLLSSKTSAKSDTRSYVKSQAAGADLASFRLSRIIAEKNIQIEEDYTLDQIGVAAGALKTELDNIINEEIPYRADSGGGTYKAQIQSQKRNARPQEIRRVDTAKLDIDGNTTVREVIEQVAELLMEQVK